MPFERDAFFDLRQWNDVSTTARLDQEPIDQSQRQRQAEDERRPFSGDALDGYAAREAPGLRRGPHRARRPGPTIR